MTTAPRIPDAGEAYVADLFGLDQPAAEVAARARADMRRLFGG